MNPLLQVWLLSASTPFSMEK